jgi:hypothetical protein
MKFLMKSFKTAFHAYFLGKIKIKVSKIKVGEIT